MAQATRDVMELGNAIEVNAPGQKIDTQQLTIRATAVDSQDCRASQQPSIKFTYVRG
jgi:hypothetical protein